MKKTLTSLIGVVLLISILFVAVTANDYKKKEGTGQGNSEQEKLVTIGFSQVGAESNWRTANSISIKQTFTPERGYDLLFEDANRSSPIRLWRFGDLFSRKWTISYFHRWWKADGILYWKRQRAPESR